MVRMGYVKVDITGHGNPMADLAGALARFNRAEPDLVFRDAFGHTDNPLRLSSTFRRS